MATEILYFTVKNMDRFLARLGKTLSKVLLYIYDGKFSIWFFYRVLKWAWLWDRVYQFKATVVWLHFVLCFVICVCLAWFLSHISRWQECFFLFAFSCVQTTFTLDVKHFLLYATLSQYIHTYPIICRLFEINHHHYYYYDVYCLTQHHAFSMKIIWIFIQWLKCTGFLL